jgi:hypothetical protein
MKNVTAHRKKLCEIGVSISFGKKKQVKLQTLKNPIIKKCLFTTIDPHQKKPNFRTKKKRDQPVQLALLYQRQHNNT